MIGTRERLILAAEHLFAAHGIDAVSLRQINQAAGQKNASALHYHVGSRDALIEAIFQMRMTGVNERRLEKLATLEKEGRTKDLHAIVEAMVLPLAEQLHAPDNYYIRFLAQAYSNPNINIPAIVGGRLDTGMSKAVQMVLQIFPEIPARIIRRRILLMAGHMVHVLADLDWRLEGPDSKNKKAEVPLHVAILIDTIVGALSVPASQMTLEQLAEAEKRPA